MATEVHLISDGDDDEVIQVIDDDDDEEVQVVLGLTVDEAEVIDVADDEEGIKPPEEQPHPAAATKEAATKEAYERTKNLIGGSCKTKAFSSGEERKELPAWAKLALLHDSSLDFRQCVAQFFGTGTIRNAQVAAYAKNVVALIKASAKGHATTFRVVDSRKKTSRYKAVWDLAYLKIATAVKQNEPMSCYRIRGMVTAAAEETKLDKKLCSNLIARIPAFKKRYRISLVSASRVCKDEPDVMLNKVRQFHLVREANRGAISKHRPRESM